MATHIVFIIFLFALGATVGSFLNVVVWRLPRGKSLVHPPSACPQCGHRLAWKDNIPIVGWIFLGGKCRYCKAEISARYPIVEAVTASLFALLYVVIFLLHLSPCAPAEIVEEGLLMTRLVPRIMTDLRADYAIFGLYLFMISSLLAASLIDAELLIIPVQIAWLMAAVGIGVHAIVDRPTVPGALNLMDSTGLSAALAAGGGIGLLVSIILFQLRIIPQAFPEGEPALEIDEELYAREVEDAKREGRAPMPRPPVYSPSRIRAEMLKELMFLLPPIFGAILLAALARWIGPVRSMWANAIEYHWVSGLLGSVLGALVGAFVVWVARILGTLAFGRIAMGLGDVHLMFGVGAIIGAGASTVAFFLAPFAALAIHGYLWLMKRKRELPFGPYLSLASAVVILVYCPIAEWFRPGMSVLWGLLSGESPR
jgi:leader peptidase (prepilin peptidase)/N-methyltransferase